LTAVDRIIAKGRGNKKPLPPKAKQLTNFKYNLDPIENNPVDIQNQSRIANDPSREPGDAATDQATNNQNFVPRNANNNGINAATLIKETERKFELSYDNLKTLMGLTNGSIDIRMDGVNRILYIDYKADSKADMKADDLNKSATN